VSAALAALLVPALLAQETIGGRPYVKRATRAETEKAMLAALSGVDVEWGPWQWSGPDPLPGGSKQLASIARPKTGERAWRTLDGSSEQGGADGSSVLDLTALARSFAPAGAERAALPTANVLGFLRRTIRAKSDSKVEAKVGSDDGLRLWLDGRLLIDAPVERGFDDEQHRVALELQAGEHELLAAIAQDHGGWNFALAPDVALDRVAQAQLDWRLQLDFPEGESRHWRIATLPTPASIALEVGGVDLLPDGRPIVCTRRGDVFVVDGAFAEPPVEPKLALFASGLHEPLGVAVRPDSRSKDGWCALLAQRGELTRLVDLDGDLRADLLETACDAWRVSGNYHEYAFGPRFDDEGGAWITLNLAHIDGPTVMGAPVPTRGCAVRVRPDGRMEVMADGLRSPDGIAWLPGLGAAYTDNQGDYVATNKLSLLAPGSFHGHQASLPFRAQEPGALKPAAWKSGDPVPPRREPAIWFPYSKMGQSASDVVVDESDGKFGPFAGQLLVGDQTHATIMRVFLERVAGAAAGDAPPGEAAMFQGACFPFRGGFKSGVHRMRFAPDGSLLVGLTDRGWGSRGAWRDGLERVTFTGATPFEILAVRAKPEGFELELTADADPASAADPASFRVTSWTYEYHPAYGSAEMESAPQRVASARLLGPRRLRLSIAALRAGFVHELAAPGLRSGSGAPLLHDTAWYTLQRVPSEP
jgi:hypothetical protein